MGYRGCLRLVIRVGYGDYNTTMPRKRSINLWTVKSNVRREQKSYSRDEVAEAFADSPLSELDIYLLDTYYRALPKRVWDMMLSWSQVDKLRYSRNVRDCDDFASIFRAEVLKNLYVNGIALVIDYSGRHAYNCVLVVSDGGWGGSYAG